ncbi:taste receptor type 2 member 7-like [Hemicordylus capensis]|uniref:taste receptor type 2 member 7-like n=1 Tax=Hemicordylus capensis TaxID=884348 RepID=UPI002303B93A|nr:taste receptor type 2 member 7-like [Hemicordylus capensis]
MSVLWIYFTVANYSSLTSLTVFYCVKVTNFAHPLFLWMKSRIDRLVPRMLTMLFFIYVVIYLPSIVTILATEKCCNLTGNLTEKKVYSKMAHEYIKAVEYPLYLSFTTINFSIYLTASFLLLFSLWRHTRNLKKKGIGIKDLSTQVHISVIIPQLLSLFIYIFHFVLMTNVLIQAFEFGNTRQLIADTILNSCSSAHSVILILTNPKLKGACARILRIRGGSTSKQFQERRPCS